MDLVAEIQPHVIAVTETWLKPTHDNSIINLNNYTIFRRDRNIINPDTGRFLMGGGVACLIHKSLKAKILYTPITQHLNEPEFQILDITSTTGEHLLLSVIYRRPNGNLLNEFFEIHSNLATNFKNIVITGDLNCDLLSSAYFSNHLKTFIAELSLHCVPYGATHHINSKDSWLDVVLLDNKCKQGTFFRSKQPFINGHDYLYCEYIFDVPNKVEKSITYRKFSVCNHNILSNRLFHSLNVGNRLLSNTNPNDLLKIFQTNVLTTLDEFAPLCTRKVTRPPNPWLTRELKTKCKERDALYKRAKRTGNANLLSQFKIRRKELKLELNIARENYLKNALTNLPHGTTVWSKLKHLGLVKKSTSSPLNHFEAEELNNYYASIVRRHPSCNIEIVNSLLSSVNSQVNCSFEWSKIDIVEVTKALHLTLQKSKGKSPDGIDLKWLKDYIPQISIFLTALFNRSIDSSIFPSAWKSVYIIPLNKISPPRSLSDTRPIANTSHLSKVFERVIANQVVNYLESNELLDKYQSGFRKHHGTQSALLKLINDINRAMDDNKLTLLVLFDLTKAFDYVNPVVILKTLIEMGFSVNSVLWFFSYLSNRTQSVLDNMAMPVEFLETTSGVPQGSVLGPILFLLVMNSVAKKLIYSYHGLFADDMYIYLHFHLYQLHEAVRQITVDAQAVADWARDNGLEINLQKTKSMILGTGSRLKMLQREKIPHVVVDGTILPYTDSTKCLGLHISSNLSWNSHISKTVSKINSSLYSLKLRKNIYTVDIRRLLVSATILPLIDYCSIALTSSTLENNRKLQCALNSAVRFVFNLKRDEHVTPFRRELGWLSVKSRRTYYLCCYFYKLLSVSKPSYLRELFVEDVDVRRSDRLAAKKNNVTFKIPNFTTTHYEFSFVVTAIRLWEELPTEVINASSIEIFKNKVYDYLFNLDL